jgi:hypothetical protein
MPLIDPLPHDAATTTTATTAQVSETTATAPTALDVVVRPADELRDDFAPDMLRDPRNPRRAFADLRRLRTRVAALEIATATHPAEIAALQVSIEKLTAEMRDLRAAIDFDHAVRAVVPALSAVQTELLTALWKQATPRPADVAAWVTHQVNAMRQQRR